GEGRRARSGTAGSAAAWSRGRRGHVDARGSGAGGAGARPRRGGRGGCRLTRVPASRVAMVTMSEARRLALSLPETTEEDHHGIPSFPGLGKIFATVPDDDHLRGVLDPDAAHAPASTDPAACG